MKKTKTVLILAAVTGALLLGGCGSEKTKYMNRPERIFPREATSMPWRSTRARSRTE